MPNSQHNTPTVIIVLGATGDLMSRKIVPSLFDLYTQNKLPVLTQVIGFARRDLSTTDLQTTVKDILINQKSNHSPELIEKFAQKFSYHQGDFNDRLAYEKLAEQLGRIDGQWNACSNKLFYLAVPPVLYENIFNELEHSGLTIPCSDQTGWTRVLVEKPFGSDQKTAADLDMLLGKLFKEEQIYRIDHYLAKEMLQGIIDFRFSNNLFENSWNKDTIEKIEIKFLEKLDVEQRGAFYDQIGALRDVGQNHLLQMLAIVTMDQPIDESCQALRKSRAQLLNSLKILTEDEIKAKTYRAQYEGYRQTAGVAADSQTETYFKLETQIESDRFKGVPIILEAGKAMGHTTKQIVVTFKHPEPCFCPPESHLQNKVIFSFEPEESIKIEFWTKKPGLDREQIKRDFEFLVYNQENNTKSGAYSKLLLDCIEGDQRLFVSTDEVKAMWQFSDPIINYWRSHNLLETYPQGTTPQINFTNQTNKKMSLGIVGLGKMGSGIAQHLLEEGFTVYGYNRTEAVTQNHIQYGLKPTKSLQELVENLPAPRVIWLMLTAGEATDNTIFGENGLAKYLKPGDILIDGGNSFYEDTIKRAQKLAKLGIKLIDVGTSGGPSGARHGACLMVGGTQEEFNYIQPILEAIATKNGLQFFEGNGAGHFVKMVHNGIEYGMMQAIAEGFNLMKQSDFKPDLERVVDIYSHQSVIESRLITWLGQAFKTHGVDLKDVTGTVAHTGEGAWTIETAKKLHQEVKVIEESLQFRKDSVNNPNYTGQLLSAIREQFGGHSIK